MSLNSQNNPSSVVVPLGVVSADTTVKALKLSRAMKLKALHLIDPTGVAASDTNYLVVQVKQGSTVIASYSTKLTGGDSALGANAWSSKQSIDADMDAGDVDVFVDITGTAALADGSKVSLELYG